jgi:hypothetical protein
MVTIESFTNAQKKHYTLTAVLDKTEDLEEGKKTNLCVTQHLKKITAVMTTAL